MDLSEINRTFIPVVTRVAPSETLTKLMKTAQAEARRKQEEARAHDEETARTHARWSSD